MKSEVRIGLAVGLGYFLGRRRKLRSALVLAAAVAIGRASREPGGLLRRGQELIQSPQLSNLGRLGGPLASAGRVAAATAASSGIDALGGRLRDGADALRRRSMVGGRRDGAAEAAGAAEPDDAPEDDDAEYDEEYDDDRKYDDDREYDGEAAEPAGSRRGR